MAMERQSVVQVVSQDAVHMGRSLVSCRLPSVVVGNIGRRHRSWRLMAFGNRTTKRRTSSTARCHTHGAKLSKLPIAIGCCGLCLALLQPPIRALRGLSWLCNVGIGNNTWLRVACWGCCRHVSARQVYVRHMSGVRLVWLGWIPACAATS